MPRRVYVKAIANADEMIAGVNVAARRVVAVAIEERGGNVMTVLVVVLGNATSSGT